MQTVVQQEDGRLVSLGVPQTLLAYEPHEGVWLEMVGEWIRRHRWRGKEPCWPGRYGVGAVPHLRPRGPARAQGGAEGFKAEDVGKTLVMVELKSVTKTEPVELSGAVEGNHRAEASTPSDKTYTATLTTGRIYPSSQEMLLQNRLGLCVTAYDISPQP